MHEAPPLLPAGWTSTVLRCAVLQLGLPAVNVGFFFLNPFPGLLLSALLIGATVALVWPWRLWVRATDPVSIPLPRPRLFLFVCALQHVLVPLLVLIGPLSWTWTPVTLGYGEGMKVGPFVATYQCAAAAGCHQLVLYHSLRLVASCARRSPLVQPSPDAVRCLSPILVAISAVLLALSAVGVAGISVPGTCVLALGCITAVLLQAAVTEGSKRVEETDSKEALLPWHAKTSGNGGLRSVATWAEWMGSWYGQVILTLVGHLSSAASITFAIVQSEEVNLLQAWVWIILGISVFGVLTCALSLVQRVKPQLKFLPADDNFRVSCVWKAAVLFGKAQLITNTPPTQSTSEILLSVTFAASLAITAVVTFAFGLRKAWRRSCILWEFAHPRIFLLEYICGFVWAKATSVYLIVIALYAARHPSGHQCRIYISALVFYPALVGVVYANNEAARYIDGRCEAVEESIYGNGRGTEADPEEYENSALLQKGGDPRCVKRGHSASALGVLAYHPFAFLLVTSVGAHTIGALTSAECMLANPASWALAGGLLVFVALSTFTALTTAYGRASEHL